MKQMNIFNLDGLSRDREFSELILSADGEFKMERVVSFGHASPDGFWYDQLEDEWVLLAKGTAQIEFDGGDIADMVAGDYVVIMAGMRHRVTEVSEDAIWLGFFF
ncbi:MAG: phosphoribosylaminoimidazole carboxylase [Bacteroidales bacterium]